MPFARKHSSLQRDATHPGVLWSKLECNRKQLLLFEDELKSGHSRYERDNAPNVQYSVDTSLLSEDENAYNADLVIGLEITKPLFKVYEVRRIEVELVDRSEAPAIIKNNPERKNYNFGCCDFSKEKAEMVRAQDPSAELVPLTIPNDQALTKAGARFAYREFVENVYCTTSNGRFTASELRDNPSYVRLFDCQGKQYIWKLSDDFQGVSIYEMWMDQRIRRYSGRLISDANDDAWEDIDVEND